MKITVVSSRVVKPDYGDNAPPPTTDVTTLSVFDMVTYDKHVYGIHFFHPPLPPTAALETGLAKALAAYREWAGRFGVDDADGNRAVLLLNDMGARFVEATADVALGGVALLEQTPELRSLCPSGTSDTELMLVQVTRFACGSFAVGTAAHHVVADAHGRCSFMAAWGDATRGAAVDRPFPFHDRASLFAPRNYPARVESEHKARDDDDEEKKVAGTDSVVDNDDDTVVVRTVHFTPAMVAELKSRATPPGAAARPPSSLQCVAAHLWRCVTKARGLDGDTVTTLKMAVSGRPRMRDPRVPEGYAGNVVLSAKPAATAGELLAMPLRRAVELVSREVARMDGRHFRSFIDTAGSNVKGLVPVVTLVESPDVFVSSLKGIPMYDVDFGTGRPFLFTSGQPPMEGFLDIVPPPPSSDGSMDVQVGLYSRAVDAFMGCCYSLDDAQV